MAEIMSSGAWCILSNRTAYGMYALKFGAFGRCTENNKSAMLADFSPVATGEMENRLLAGTDMEHAWGYPYSMDFSKRSIENLNLVWALSSAQSAFGAQRCSGFPITTARKIAEIPHGSISEFHLWVSVHRLYP